MYRLINWTFDLLNKKSRILFHTPPHRSFGNCAEEMFFGLLQAKRENKKILFMYPRLRLFGLKFRLANEELFHLESNHAISNINLSSLLAGWLVSLYLFSLHLLGQLRGSKQFRSILMTIRPKSTHVTSMVDHSYGRAKIGQATLWKPSGTTVFSWKNVEEQNWALQYQEYVPPRISEAKLQYAQQRRIAMGIPPTEWFVCLHFRENENNVSHYRDSSTAQYIEAIKFITSSGGWVVRIGDSATSPLPPMERVIDYAHRQDKSPIMDLYFINQCRFFVGTASGPTFVAMLFQKPAVLVNLAEWTLGLLSGKDSLFIPRHIFSRFHNRFLSVREILEEPYAVTGFEKSHCENYIFVENTSEEIKEVIKEFLDRKSVV